MVNKKHLKAMIMLHNLEKFLFIEVRDYPKFLNMQRQVKSLKKQVDNYFITLT